jgi:hypothetical protein
MTTTEALLVGSGIYAVLHAFMSNDTWTLAALRGVLIMVVAWFVGQVIDQLARSRR